MALCERNFQRLTETGFVSLSLEMASKSVKSRHESAHDSVTDTQPTKVLEVKLVKTKIASFDGHSPVSIFESYDYTTVNTKH